MQQPKRKFIEGHSYVDIHRFTRNLSFWELEESYKVMKEYRSENHDMKIPVCIRLKEGDIRVKKFDDQLGLDPKTYYGNAHDIAFVTYSAYDSRVEMKNRFLSGKIEEYPQYDVSKLSAIELLNLKEFLVDLNDEWVYFDKVDVEDGENFYIFETIAPHTIRTVYKNAIADVKERNAFLLKYGDRNTKALDFDEIVNLINHFRPAVNILREVVDAIDNL